MFDDGGGRWIAKDVKGAEDSMAYLMAAYSTRVAQKFVPFLIRLVAYCTLVGQSLIGNMCALRNQARKAGSRDWSISELGTANQNRKGANFWATRVGTTKHFTDTFLYRSISSRGTPQ